MKIKILISLIVIISVIALATISTRALFTARVSNPAANFSAGTLDLSVTGSGVSDTISVGDIGASPSASGEKIWNIENIGTLPGKFLFSLSKLENFENGCNGPEAKADITCNNPGLNEGELSKVIKVRVFLNDKEIISEIPLSSLTDKITYFVQNSPAIILNGGEKTKFILKWSVNENDYGNEIQGDSVNFGFDFSLAQIPS